MRGRFFEFVIKASEIYLGDEEYTGKCEYSLMVGLIAMSAKVRTNDPQSPFRGILPFACGFSAGDRPRLGFSDPMAWLGAGLSVIVRQLMFK